MLGIDEWMTARHNAVATGLTAALKPRNALGFR